MKYIWILLFSISFAYGQNAEEDLCKPKTSDLIDRTYYELSEVMPSFPGGIEKLFKFLKKEYKRLKLNYYGESIAYARFFVDIDGSLIFINIARPPADENITKKLTKIFLKMPNWIPGTCKGEKLLVRFNLPMRY